jgi:hypothetical protein
LRYSALVTDVPELKALDAAAAKFRKIDAERDRAREKVIEAVVAALKADVPPTVVADRSPFTAAYVRTVAREHGIPPAKPGIKPRVPRGDPTD